MQTLTYDTPLMELEEEQAYTTARLRAHPLTISMITGFNDMETEWVQVVSREATLVRQLAAAGAAIDIADDLLDILFNAIVNSLLTAVNNDRANPLYLRFFPTQPPSAVRQPVLGEQLEAMRSWAPTLERQQALLTQLEAEAAEKQLTKKEKTMQAELAKAAKAPIPGGRTQGQAR